MSGTSIDKLMQTWKANPEMRRIPKINLVPVDCRIRVEIVHEGKVVDTIHVSDESNQRALKAGEKRRAIYMAKQLWPNNYTHIDFFTHKAKVPVDPCPYCGGTGVRNGNSGN